MEELSSPRFKSKGFDNIVEKREDGLQVRTNVFDENQWEQWRYLFSELTYTSFNVAKTLEGSQETRSEFRQSLMCLHGDGRHKGIRKTFTG